MNTNNVYYAKIYRLMDIETYGSDFSSLGKNFKLSFSRDALVYEKSNGKFYDLLGKKHLSSDLDWCAKIGMEFVDIKSLIPFNIVVNQNKENLSKRKIKKMYIYHQK